MLHWSLGAASLAGFWRYWNPIWGYYLSRYVNVPLRTFMQAAPATIATFAVSGAIHDAAAYAVTGSLTFLFAPWFAVLGLMVAAFTRAGLRYEFRTWPVRAAINIALVVGALASSQSASGCSTCRDSARRSVQSMTQFEQGHVVV